MLITRPLIKKTVCLLLSFFCLVEWLNPAQGYTSSPIQRVTGTAVPVTLHFGSFHLPAKLGRIESVWDSHKTSPVILIQDAHAIPEAQKNIKRIIQYFQKEHGIKNIAFEGAAGKQDFQILKSFPDKKRLQKVMEEYRARGELTGVQAADILLPGVADFHGIEDWDLYEKGLRAYLTASADRHVILKKLKTEQEALDRSKKDIYSPQLLDLDQAIVQFNRHKMQLGQFLKDLSAIRNPGPGTQLEILLKEILNESPEYRNTGKRDKRFEAIQGSGLFHELETYIQQVKESLFRNNAERALDKKSRELWFREKLARLELSRAEWEEIKPTPSSLILGHSPLPLPGGEGQLPEASLAVGGGEGAAFVFYRNAELREQAFLKKLSPGSILVVGGFHTPGLTQKLKEKNISHVVITPAMKALPEKDFYARQMRGNVSWKKYFRPGPDGKINLYDAFVRGIRDELLNVGAPLVGALRAGTSPAPTFQKMWRDQILRDLADQKRLQDGSKYTQYLDEMTVGASLADAHKSGQAQGLPLLTKINSLISGLRRLDHAGQVSEQNILKLLGFSIPSAFVTATGVRGLTLPSDIFSRSEVRSGLFKDLSRREFIQTTAKAIPVTRLAAIIGPFEILPETLTEPTQSKVLLRLTPDEEILKVLQYDLDDILHTAALAKIDAVAKQENFPSRQAMWEDLNFDPFRTNLYFRPIHHLLEKWQKSISTEKFEELAPKIRKAEQEAQQMIETNSQEWRDYNKKYDTTHHRYSADKPELLPYVKQINFILSVIEKKLKLDLLRIYKQLEPGMLQYFRAVQNLSAEDIESLSQQNETGSISSDDIFKRSHKNLGERNKLETEIKNLASLQKGMERTFDAYSGAPLLWDDLRHAIRIRSEELEKLDVGSGLLPARSELRQANLLRGFENGNSSFVVSQFGEDIWNGRFDSSHIHFQSIQPFQNFIKAFHSLAHIGQPLAKYAKLASKVFENNFPLTVIRKFWVFFTHTNTPQLISWGERTVARIKRSVNIYFSQINYLEIAYRITALMLLLGSNSNHSSDSHMTVTAIPLSRAEVRKTERIKQEDGGAAILWILAAFAISALAGELVIAWQHRDDAINSNKLPAVLSQPANKTISPAIPRSELRVIQYILDGVKNWVMKIREARRLNENKSEPTSKPKLPSFDVMGYMNKVETAIEAAAAGTPFPKDFPLPATQRQTMFNNIRKEVNRWEHAPGLILLYAIAFYFLENIPSLEEIQRLEKLINLYNSKINDAESKPASVFHQACRQSTTSIFSLTLSIIHKQADEGQYVKLTRRFSMLPGKYKYLVISRELLFSGIHNNVGIDPIDIEAVLPLAMLAFQTLIQKELPEELKGLEEAEARQILADLKYGFLIYFASAYKQILASERERYFQGLKNLFYQHTDIFFGWFRALQKEEVEKAYSPMRASKSLDYSLYAVFQSIPAPVDQILFRIFDYSHYPLFNQSARWDHAEEIDGKIGPILRHLVSNFPVFARFSDFHPSLEGNVQKMVEGEKTVYFTINFNRPVDPRRIIVRARYLPIGAEPRDWQEKEAEWYEEYDGSRTFRYRIQLPASEYKLKVSYNFGQSWISITQPVFTIHLQTTPRSEVREQVQDWLQVAAAFATMFVVAVTVFWMGNKNHNQKIRESLVVKPKAKNAWSRLREIANAFHMQRQDRNDLQRMLPKQLHDHYQEIRYLQELLEKAAVLEPDWGEHDFHQEAEKVLFQIADYLADIRIESQFQDILEILPAGMVMSVLVILISLGISKIFFLPMAILEGTGFLLWYLSQRWSFYHLRSISLPITKDSKLRNWKPEYDDNKRSEVRNGELPAEIADLINAKGRNREQWIKILHYFVSTLPQEPEIVAPQWDFETLEFFAKRGKSLLDWQKIILLLKSKLPPGVSSTLRHLATISKVLTADEILEGIEHYKLSLDELQIQKTNASEPTMKNVAAAAAPYLDQRKIINAMFSKKISSEDAGMFRLKADTVKRTHGETRETKKLRMETEIRRTLTDLRTQYPDLSGRALTERVAAKVKLRPATMFSYKARQLGVDLAAFGLEVLPAYESTPERTWLRDNLKRGLSQEEKILWISTTLQLAEFGMISMTGAYALIKAIRTGKSRVRDLEREVSQDLGLHKVTVHHALIGYPDRETSGRSANVFDFLASSLNKKLQLERNFPTKSRESNFSQPLMYKYNFPFFIEKLLLHPRLSDETADFLNHIVAQWDELQDVQRNVLRGVIRRRSSEYKRIGAALTPHLSGGEVRAMLLGPLEDWETGLYQQLHERILNSDAWNAKYQLLLRKAGFKEDHIEGSFFTWLLRRRPIGPKVREAIERLAIYDAVNLPNLELWPGKKVPLSGQLAILNARFLGLSAKEIAAQAKDLIHDEAVQDLTGDPQKIQRWFTGVPRTGKGLIGGIQQLREALDPANFIQQSLHHSPISKEVVTEILQNTYGEQKAFEYIELIEKRKTPAAFFLKTAAVLAKEKDPLLLNPIKIAQEKIEANPSLTLDQRRIVEIFANDFIQYGHDPKYRIDFFTAMLEAGHALRQRIPEKLLISFLNKILHATFPGEDPSRFRRQYPLSSFAEVIRSRPKNLFMHRIYRGVVQQVYSPVQIVSDDKKISSQSWRPYVREKDLLNIAEFEGALKEHQRRLHQQKEIVKEFLGDGESVGLWPIEKIQRHIIDRYHSMLKIDPKTPGVVSKKAGMELEDLSAEALQVLNKVAYVYNDPPYAQPIQDPEKRREMISLMEEELQITERKIREIEEKTPTGKLSKKDAKKLNFKIKNQITKKAMLEIALRAQRLLEEANAAPPEEREEILRQAATVFLEIKNEYLALYRESHVVALVTKLLHYRLLDVFEKHAVKKESILTRAVSIHERFSGEREERVDALSYSMLPQEAEMAKRLSDDPAFHKRLLKAIQTTLDPREQLIFALRFGLDPVYPGISVELEDIGQILTYRSIPNKFGRFEQIAKQRVQEIIQLRMSKISEAMLKLTNEEQGAAWDKYLENLGVVAMEDPEPIFVRLGERGEFSIGKHLRIWGERPDLAGKTLQAQIGDPVPIRGSFKDRATGLFSEEKNIPPYDITLTLREGSKIQAVYDITVQVKQDRSVWIKNILLVSSVRSEVRAQFSRRDFLRGSGAAGMAGSIAEQFAGLNEEEVKAVTQVIGFLKNPAALLDQGSYRRSFSTASLRKVLEIVRGVMGRVGASHPLIGLVTGVMSELTQRIENKDKKDGLGTMQPSEIYEVKLLIERPELFSQWEMVSRIADSLKYKAGLYPDRIKEFERVIQNQYDRTAYVNDIMARLVAPAAHKEYDAMRVELTKREMINPSIPDDRRHHLQQIRSYLLDPSKVPSLNSISHTVHEFKINLQETVQSKMTGEVMAELRSIFGDDTAIPNPYSLANDREIAYIPPGASLSDLRQWAVANGMVASAKNRVKRLVTMRMKQANIADEVIREEINNWRFARQDYLNIDPQKLAEQLLEKIEETIPGLAETPRAETVAQENWSPLKTLAHQLEEAAAGQTIELRIHTHLDQSLFAVFWQNENGYNKQVITRFDKSVLEAAWPQHLRKPGHHYRIRIPQHSTAKTIEKYLTAESLWSQWDRPDSPHVTRLTLPSVIRSEARSSEIQIQQFAEDVYRVLRGISPEVLSRLHTLRIASQQSLEWRGLNKAESDFALAEAFLIKQGYYEATLQNERGTTEFLPMSVTGRKEKINHLYFVDFENPVVPFGKILNQLERMVNQTENAGKDPKDKVEINLNDFGSWRQLKEKYELRPAAAPMPAPLTQTEIFQKKVETFLEDLVRDQETVYRHRLHFEVFGDGEFEDLLDSDVKAASGKDQNAVWVLAQKKWFHWQNHGFYYEEAQNYDKDEKPDDLIYFFYIEPSRVNLPQLLETIGKIVEGEESHAGRPLSLAGLSDWQDLKKKYVPRSSKWMKWNPYFFWDVLGHLRAVILDLKTHQGNIDLLNRALEDVKANNFLAARQKINLAIRDTKEKREKAVLRQYFDRQIAHLETTLQALDKALSGKYGWRSFIEEHPSLIFLFLFFDFTTVVVFFGMVSSIMDLWHDRPGDPLLGITTSASGIFGLILGLVFYLKHLDPRPYHIPNSKSNLKPLNVLEWMSGNEMEWDQTIPLKVKGEDARGLLDILDGANYFLQKIPGEQKRFKKRMYLLISVVFFASFGMFFFYYAYSFIPRAKETGEMGLLELVFALITAASPPSYSVLHYNNGSDGYDNKKMFLTTLRQVVQKKLQYLGHEVDINYRHRSEVRDTQAEVEQFAGDVNRVLKALPADLLRKHHEIHIYSNESPEWEAMNAQGINLPSPRKVLAEKGYFASGSYREFRERTQDLREQKISHYYFIDFKNPILPFREILADLTKSINIAENSNRHADEKIEIDLAEFDRWRQLETQYLNETTREHKPHMQIKSSQKPMNVLKYIPREKGAWDVEIKIMTQYRNFQELHDMIDGANYYLEKNSRRKVWGKVGMGILSSLVVLTPTIIGPYFAAIPAATLLWFYFRQNRLMSNRLEYLIKLREKAIQKGVIDLGSNIDRKYRHPRSEVRTSAQEPRLYYSMFFSQDLEAVFAIEQSKMGNQALNKEELRELLLTKKNHHGVILRDPFAKIFGYAVFKTDFNQSSPYQSSEHLEVLRWVMDPRLDEKIYLKNFLLSLHDIVHQAVHIADSNFSSVAFTVEDHRQDLIDTMNEFEWIEMKHIPNAFGDGKDGIRFYGWFPLTLKRSEARNLKEGKGINASASADGIFWKYVPHGIPSNRKHPQDLRRLSKWDLSWITSPFTGKFNRSPYQNRINDNTTYERDQKEISRAQEPSQDKRPKHYSRGIGGPTFISFERSAAESRRHSPALIRSEVRAKVKEWLKHGIDLLNRGWDVLVGRMQKDITGSRRGFAKSVATAGLVRFDPNQAAGAMTPEDTTVMSQLFSLLTGWPEKEFEYDDEEGKTAENLRNLRAKFKEAVHAGRVPKTIQNNMETAEGAFSAAMKALESTLREAPSDTRQDLFDVEMAAASEEEFNRWQTLMDFRRKVGGRLMLNQQHEFPEIYQKAKARGLTGDALIDFILEEKIYPKVIKYWIELAPRIKSLGGKITKDFLLKNVRTRVFRVLKATGVSIWEWGSLKDRELTSEGISGLARGIANQQLNALWTPMREKIIADATAKYGEDASVDALKSNIALARTWLVDGYYNKDDSKPVRVLAREWNERVDYDSAQQRLLRRIKENWPEDSEAGKFLEPMESRHLAGLSADELNQIDPVEYTRQRIMERGAEQKRLEKKQWRKWRKQQDQQVREDQAPATDKILGLLVHELGKFASLGDVELMIQVDRKGLVSMVQWQLTSNQGVRGALSVSERETLQYVWPEALRRKYRGQTYRIHIKQGIQSNWIEDFLRDSSWWYKASGAKSDTHITLSRPAALPAPPRSEVRAAVKNESQEMRAKLRQFLRRELKDRPIDPSKYVYIDQILPYRILVARDSQEKVLGFAFGKKENQNFEFLPTEPGQEPDGFFYRPDPNGIRIVTFVNGTTEAEKNKQFKEDEFVLGRFGSQYRLDIHATGGQDLLDAKGNKGSRGIPFNEWLPSYMLTKSKEVSAIAKVIGPQLAEGLESFLPEDSQLVLVPGMDPESTMTFWPGKDGVLHTREEVFGGLDHEGFDVTTLRDASGKQEILKVEDKTPIPSLVNEPGIVQWTFEDNVQSTAIVLTNLTVPIGSENWVIPEDADRIFEIEFDEHGDPIQKPGLKFTVKKKEGELYRIAIVYTHLELEDWVKPGTPIDPQQKNDPIGRLQYHRKYPNSPVAPHLHFAVMLFKESEIAKYPALNYQLINSKLGPEQTILYVNPLNLLTPEQRTKIFVEGEEAMPGFQSLGLISHDKLEGQKLRARLGHTFSGIPIYAEIANSNIHSDVAAHNPDLIIEGGLEDWKITPGSRIAPALQPLPFFVLEGKGEETLFKQLSDLEFFLRNKTTGKIAITVNELMEIVRQQQEGASLRSEVRVMSAPIPREFHFDVPTNILAANVIQNWDAKDAAARLERLHFSKRLPDDRRAAAMKTLESLSSAVPDFLKHFRMQYPGYDAIHLSVFGSYPTEANPHDLDLNIIVKGKAFEFIDSEEIAAFFPQGLAKPVERIHIVIIGEDYLKGTEKYTGKAQPDIQNIQSIIDKTRAEIYIRNFVLWGRDLAPLSDQASVILTSVYTLLDSAYQRMLGNYFRPENEKTRYQKALKRLRSAESFLNYLFSTSVPKDMFDQMQQLADDLDMSGKINELQKLLIQDFYKSVMAVYDTHRSEMREEPAAIAEKMVGVLRGKTERKEAKEVAGVTVKIGVKPVIEQLEILRDQYQEAQQREINKLIQQLIRLPAQKYVRRGSPSLRLWRPASGYAVTYRLPESGSRQKSLMRAVEKFSPEQLNQVGIYKQSGQTFIPGFQSAMKQEGRFWSVLRRLSQMPVFKSEQAFAALIADPQVVKNEKIAERYIPLINQDAADETDPFIDELVFVMETATALLLAEEITTEAERDGLLRDPLARAALLKKYHLFSGFENQVFTNNGDALAISPAGMRLYLDWAVEKSLKSAA